MERYQCPCCGAPYNGKRCRECFYEPFTEEITHGLHTHEGEPLVISDPAKRPVRRAGASRRQECGDYSGRRKSTLLKWAMPVVIVLAAILLRNALSKPGFDGIWDIPAPDYTDMEPDAWDTVVRPEDFGSQTVLYDAEGIQVIADWCDETAGEKRIPVYVRNDSDRDVWIVSTFDSVNGYMARYNFLACSVQAGEELSTELWIDDSDLENGGIEAIGELSFRLEIDDAAEYTTIGQTPQITLRIGAERDHAQPPEDGGTLIYRQDGVEVYYTGREGETWEDGLLLFRIENHSDRSVQVCTLEAAVNGKPADLFLFQDLTPGAWTKTDMMLYSLSDLGLKNIRDITSLEIVLAIWDGDNGDVLAQSDPITLDIQ